MRLPRKLVLRTDSLTELSGPELTAMPGGTVAVVHTIPCLGTELCPVTELVSAYWLECPSPQLTAPDCTGTCVTRQ